MHPVMNCDVARLRHSELRRAARGRPGWGSSGPPPAGPAARLSTEVTALLLRRSIAVAERRALRLERDTARLAAALVEVEARARATRARLA